MNTVTNNTTAKEIITTFESSFKMFGMKLDKEKIEEIYNGFGDDFVDFSDAPLELEKFKKLSSLINNNAEAYCAALNIIKAYDVLDSQINLLNKYYFNWKEYFDWGYWSSPHTYTFDINSLWLNGLSDFLKLLLHKPAATTVTGKELFGVKYGLRRFTNIYVPVELYSSLNAIIDNILVLQENYKKV